MIQPEDLKNKSFSRIVRGYNPIEVDDYIAFLIAKYEQLYKENADLEKRLHIVSGKYEELANDEEAIRNAVGQARKVSEAMIQAAEKTADGIIEKVNARCEEIIEDAQIKVEAEQKKLAALRMDTAKFHEMVLNEYTRHLKNMRAVSIPSVEEVEREFPSHSAIEEQAMDDLIPSEIIERAVVSPAKDPALEEFKRFLRGGRKKLTREEKEALKKGDKDGKPLPGHLTEEILQSSVDDEDLNSDEEVNILAKAPELSVEEALLDLNDTGVLHPHTDANALFVDEDAQPKEE